MDGLPLQLRPLPAACLWWLPDPLSVLSLLPGPDSWGVEPLAGRRHLQRPVNGKQSLDVLRPQHPLPGSSQPSGVLPSPVLVLGSGGPKVFIKGPESKYFRSGRPYSLCCKHSTRLLECRAATALWPCSINLFTKQTMGQIWLRHMCTHTCTHTRTYTCILRIWSFLILLEISISSASPCPQP